MCDLLWSLTREERRGLADAGLLADFLVEPPGPPSQRGGLTDDMVTAAYDQDDNECVCCGATSDLTLDHIIPIKLGGHPAHLENLAVACRSCNTSKSHWGRCILDHD